jgi:hypothetical protein
VGAVRLYRRTSVDARDQSAPLAGVGVEHIGDSNVSVPELPAGGVNAVDRADLAAEFLDDNCQEESLFLPFRGVGH